MAPKHVLTSSVIAINVGNRAHGVVPARAQNWEQCLVRLRRKAWLHHGASAHDGCPTWTASFPIWPDPEHKDDASGYEHRRRACLGTHHEDSPEISGIIVSKRPSSSLCMSGLSSRGVHHRWQANICNQNVTNARQTAKSTTHKVAYMHTAYIATQGSTAGSHQCSLQDAKNLPKARCTPHTMNRQSTANLMCGSVMTLVYQATAYN